MGAIQNNFNQLLAMTAGAVGMAEHIKGQKIANKTTALNQFDVYQNQKEAYMAEANSLKEEQSAIDEKVAKNNQSLDKLYNKVEEQGYIKPGQSRYVSALEKSYNSLAEQQELVRQRNTTLKERVKFLNEKGSNIKALLKKADIKSLEVGDIKQNEIKPNKDLSSFKVGGKK